jgi:hypothetical protein
VEKTWNAIRAFLSENVVRLVCSALALADKVLDYVRESRKDKALKQAEAELKKAEGKVDDACDKGGVDDLFEAAEELKKARRKEKEARG